MRSRPDEMILNGFLLFDEDVTKEYFYGYCRRAYNIFDGKYHLHAMVREFTQVKCLFANSMHRPPWLQIMLVMIWRWRCQ
ncbi:MAG: hypothetical protein J6A02_01475 [Prevotella sp.]|nr:hypothetical protein [Prevotella sp.]